MKPKDLNDRLADAIETENPVGAGYYGAETDEAEVESDQQRLEHATRTQEQANRDSGIAANPVSRSERQREKPD